MPVAAKRALQALLMFVVLFAIAFLTRIPAMHIALAYAMHGFLAAPFYAFAVALFKEKTGVAWPAVVGGALVAVVLGMMSPVMAVGNGLPALVALVAALAMGKGTHPKAALAVGTAWGATAYPATVLGGVIFGSYTVLSGNVLVDVLLFVLACALAYLGALLACALCKKRA